MLNTPLLSPSALKISRALAAYRWVIFTGRLQALIISPDRDYKIPKTLDSASSISFILVRWLHFIKTVDKFMLGGAG